MDDPAIRAAFDALLASRFPADREVAAGELEQRWVFFRAGWAAAPSDAPKLVLEAPPAERSDVTTDAGWLCEAWNQTCGMVGMRRVRMPLARARERKIAGAMKQAGASKDEWRAALLACQEDRHWQGENDRHWTGCIESFLRPEHRERWLDAGADEKRADAGSIEALAEQEAKRLGVTAAEVLRGWGVKA